MLLQKYQHIKNGHIHTLITHYGLNVHEYINWLRSYIFILVAIISKSFMPALHVNSAINPLSSVYSHYDTMTFIMFVLNMTYNINKLINYIFTFIAIMLNISTLVKSQALTK